MKLFTYDRLNVLTFNTFNKNNTKKTTFEEGIWNINGPYKHEMVAHNLENVSNN